MDDSTYTIVSTALLGVIAGLLILVIARLARVERTLKGRAVEPVPAELPAVDGALAAAIAEPAAAPREMQRATDGGEAPFEKEGRWWYRQGDELLVYNEQTEAWVLPDTPSPVAETPAVETPEIEPHPLDEARGWDLEPEVTTVPEQATAAPIPEPAAAPEPIVETVEQPAGGSHWKCPACGVINGSTAASCRMCFAARP